MACIYHQVPQGMIGETLYPLSELETVAPELYRKQRAKYRDHPSRERIPYQRVPKLDCWRREVENLSPLHPYLIYKAWQNLGVTLPDVSWYQLPVKAVAHLPTVLYQPSGDVGKDIPEEGVRWLEPTIYQEVTELSEATKVWYAELHRRGLRGGWFARTPHVLVKGAVSVKDTKVIAWQDVPTSLTQIKSTPQGA